MAIDPKELRRCLGHFTTGVTASLHFACSAPAVGWGSELFGPLLMAEEMLVEPLVYDAEGLHVPAGPGLGVELDRSQIAAFRRQ